MTVIMSSKPSPILARAAIVIAAAVAVWLVFALANRGSKAMEKPEELFATALNVTQRDVAEVCRIGISGVAGLDGLVIGRYTDAGVTGTAAVPLYLEQSGAKPGSAEKLVSGRTVQMVGLFDLMAAPRKVTLTPPPCPADGYAVNADGQTTPALLLKVSGDGSETRETLVLLALGKPIKLLWMEKTTSIAANGAGHETVEMGLEMREGGPLAIVLVQQSFAARAGQDYMPGPPLTLRFELQDGRYRRMGQ